MNKIQCPYGYGKRHLFVDTPCCEDKDAMIAEMEQTIKSLEADVQDAKLDGATEVSAPVVNTPNSNVKITTPVSVDTKVTAKSIFMDGSQVNAKLDMTVSEVVEATNVEVTGNYPGSSVVVNIKEGEKMVFKGLTFNTEDAYNAFNIGLSGKILPKEITFEDCTFAGKLRNNAISVFGVQEGGVITVKNCVFENSSNAFRFSNSANVSNVTFNVINCVVKTWDSSADYAGLMICQDYTSKTADECVANNLFASEKLTINVENTIGPDGKNMTDYVKESGIQNTVVYVWRDKSNPKAVHYSEMPEAYPTVKVK